MNRIFYSIPALFILLSVACKKGNETRQEMTRQPTTTVSRSVATPDWAKNANIYEVNIRQYTPEGTFNAFAKHLPRLKAMGVDILWLMPVYPISETKRKGSLGSYYAVSDFRKTNPKFGTMTDFKNLVQQVHAQGMKIILDWVPNHTGWDHVWIKNHPDFYTKDSTGSIIDPVDSRTGKPFGWTDVADLNYDNRQLRDTMTEDMLFWLREAGIDGYRCDVAHEVPDDFWAEVAPKLRAAKSDIFMLAEAEHPEHRNSEAFAMSYAWSFWELQVAIAKGEKKAAAIDKWYQTDRDSFQKGYPMLFTTNHDKNSWDGTEQELLGDATDAMRVLAFTFTGMPLIYTGQEANLNKRLKFFEKDSIAWGNFVKQDFFKTLLDLKHQNQALWNGTDGGEPQRLNVGAPDVYAFYREKNGNKVIVLLNLSAKPQTATLNDPAALGSYSDVFAKKTTTITKGMTMQLNPWAYVVLSNP
jgi:glycosidase